MDIKILKDEKQEIDLQLDNLTIAEILRNYLNKDSGVEFAAWRREHPSKPIVLSIKTDGKTAKKAVQDAIDKIGKDTENLVREFKKAKI